MLLKVQEAAWRQHSRAGQGCWQALGVDSRGNKQGWQACKVLPRHCFGFRCLQMVSGVISHHAPYSGHVRKRQTMVRQMLDACSFQNHNRSKVTAYMYCRYIPLSWSCSLVKAPFAGAKTVILLALNVRLLSAKTAEV